MFYHRKENNYYWFKSDKDKFWFGPFESEITDDWQITDDLIKNYKSYKNLIWVWQNKVFMFEYNEKNWLKLINL